MALDGIRVSTYQDNAGPAIQPKDTVGGNVGKTIDSGSNSPYINTLDKYASGQKEIDEKYVRKEIAKANDYLKQHNVKCTFDYHEKTNRIIIRLIDEETKEIIREIPPEKTLDAIYNIWELAGLLVDERR